MTRRLFFFSFSAMTLALLGCGSPPRRSSTPPAGAAPVARVEQTAAPPSGVDGSLHRVDLGTCPLESGDQIAQCQVAFRTFGKLDAEKSNAVLFPTWFTGTTQDLVDVVPGKLVDTTRFYLVLVDALANGASSAPSNSRVQPRLSFPTITVRDMVESQRRMLGALGIRRLHAVMGISMGGMQALEWSVAYPDVAARVVSIVGTPQLTSHDLLLWTAEHHALTSDVAYRGGAYEGRPALRAVLDIHAMMLTTPAHRATETRREDFASWVSEREADLRFDWNDWRRQLEAMLSHDIAKGDGGSLDRAAKRVRAKTLVVLADQDHMVSPLPSRRWAELVSAKLVVLDGPCGHAAPGCERVKLGEAVRAFLSE